MIRNRMVLVGLLAVFVVLLALPRATGAQEVEIAYACYVPDVGAVYRIDPDGPNPGPLPTTCFEGDQEFSWILGEEPPTALPVTCTEGQIAAFQSGAWSCADAAGHTHSTADIVDFPTGTLDVTGWTLSSTTHNVPWSYEITYATLDTDCPAGKVVMSAIHGDFPASYSILEDRPLDSDTWRIEIQYSSTTAGDYPFTVELICVGPAGGG